jgi:hypothetical protein
VLESVAAAIAGPLGYHAVVINLYRPAWDDFEVTVVLGSTESRELLIGQTSSWDDWSGLIADRFLSHGAYFVPAGEYDWPREEVMAYTPTLELSDQPDAWRADDALMVPLRSASGEMLGIVSVYGIADAVLHKPARLEPHEWVEIKRHPEIGSRILEHANLRDIGAWVLAHHERIDGGGYPQGLPAAAIPVEARILAVADAYEAMTSDRPYRRALPLEEARAELRRGAGTQFDAEIVAVFERVLDRTQVPFHATLSPTAAVKPAAVRSRQTAQP